MLGIETALRDRLATLEDLRGVYGLPDAQGDISGKPLPGAFVIFNGYKVRETVNRGKAARVAGRWLVLVVVKNSAQVRDGQSTRGSAAPVVQAVLGRLMGWQPAPEYTPLELTDAPAARYDAGLLVLPLAFVTEYVVKAD
jgi:hypothetical protein